MVKKYNRMDSAILTAEILGHIAKEPLTISQLIEKLYPNQKESHNNNSIGRVYLIIEKLCEMNLAKPQFKNNKFCFSKQNHV